MSRPVVLLVAIASASSAAARDSRLAQGGFPPPPSVAAASVRTGSWPPAELARLVALGHGATVASAAATPAPKALNDHLVLSLDDDVAPLGPAWEGRLDVTGGVAGPSDAVAVRFPLQSLGTPPLDVTGVVVGLDDRYGATTWSVEAWREDPASPLQPRRGSVSATGSLDAPALGLTPTGPSRPTDFRRLRVPLALSLDDAWLSDGAFDDDFARNDGPLSDGNSGWTECEDGDCTRLPLDVDLVSGRAVRSTGGGALLVVKTPRADVEAARPHLDLDLTASVSVYDGAPGFSKAGVALRVLASDAFYRVEYQKSPLQVVVSAVLPAPVGEVPVGTLPVASPGTGRRDLRVRVTGTNPVTFDVTLDGTSLGTVTDPTYRLTGWYAGLSASDPAGSGETWDDFRVERRADVFVVLPLPAGQDAALPVDMSTYSLGSFSVLQSSDGTSFAPRGLGVGCGQPGNPFVQVDVQEPPGGRLFDHEAHVVAVGLSCPTCPRGPDACALDLGIPERSAPTLTTGQPVTASVRYWNEHLLPDTLMFTGDLWAGTCDAPTALVASGLANGVPSAGQGGTGAATDEVPVMSFVPGVAGPYCLVLQELHDENGDCCPDGEETTPMGGCPGACAPVPPSDSNAATRVTLVSLQVADPCAPLQEDTGRDGPDDLTGDRVPDEINLDGASLRVAKDAAGDAVLSWARVNPALATGTYNVHVQDPRVFERSTCFLDQAPVVRRVVQQLTATLSLSPPPGVASWIEVFETDGCDEEASVQDSSRDDPSLTGACP